MQIETANRNQGRQNHYSKNTISKALIARDIVGMDGYFEIINSTDPVMLEAIRQLETGGAAFPLTDKENDTSNVE